LKSVTAISLPLFFIRSKSADTSAFPDVLKEEWLSEQEKNTITRNDIKIIDLFIKDVVLVKHSFLKTAAKIIYFF